MSIVQSLASGTLAIALSSAALAQGYYREDIVRAVCRKDGCDEFTVLEAVPIAQARTGTLVRVKLQTYHASYQGRADRGTEDAHAFCSTSDPTLIAEFEGKLVAFHLAPLGREREPRDTINYYAMYFAVCHGLDAGKRATANKAAVGAALGYERRLDHLKSENVGRLEDFLTGR